MHPSIAQLSDFHVRGDGKLSFQKADTITLLHQTVDYFANQEEHQLPDFFVITGDLVDGGTPQGYAILKEALDKLPRPWYAVPGNHDKRAHLAEILGDAAPIDDAISPFICYTLESNPIRVIVADTSIPGCHWGGLSDDVAIWLAAKLSEDLDRPTIVFTHHAPFATGLPAMDEGFEQADTFAAILGQHHNLRLCCGHTHTPITTLWQGILCISAPSVAMQMEVDFRDKNHHSLTPQEADFKGGGDRFFLGNPAYLLHDLQDARINTHYIPIPVGADYSGPWPFKYYEGETS